MDVANILAWDATKEMVSEEEIQNIFVDDLEMEASLGIPEIRIPREAPEEPGK